MVFVTGARAKSPVTPIVVMVSVEPPVLVSTTFFAALVLPTNILPQVSDVGFRLTTGPLELTVRVTVVEAVRLPDTPEMVMVEVPAAAPAPTVRVNVLVELVGFGLKPAVTPVGRPVALRVTLPLKPPAGTTVMVLVPVLPAAMVSELGLAVRVKLGPTGPVSALMRAAPFGLPQPSHRS